MQSIKCFASRLTHRQLFSKTLTKQCLKQPCQRPSAWSNSHHKRQLMPKFKRKPESEQASAPTVSRCVAHCFIYTYSWHICAFWWSGLSWCRSYNAQSKQLLQYLVKALASSRARPVGVALGLPAGCVVWQLQGLRAALLARAAVLRGRHRESDAASDYRQRELWRGVSC